MITYFMISKTDLKKKLSYDKCEKLSVSDLKSMCRAKNIRGFSKMKKDELIENCCIKEMSINFPDITNSDDVTLLGRDVKECKGAFITSDRVALYSPNDIIDKCSMTKRIIEYINENNADLIIDASDWYDDKGMLKIDNKYLTPIAGDFYRVKYCSGKNDILTQSYIKEYVEKAIKTLHNPKVIIKCETPMFIKGEKNSVFIAPRIAYNE